MHLGAESFVDQRRWPRLVEVPEARLMGRRAADVTRRLESLLASAGINVDGRDVPFFSMRDGQVIDRIVADGWLGLAEGFMAGQWSADPLPEVLGVLLRQPFESGVGRFISSRRHRRTSRSTEHGLGARELPEGLVELYAGATRATGAAQFSAAPRTTATEELMVPVGRGRRQKVTLPVDVTWLGEPEGADRQDLDDCQMRRIETMLDEAGVRRGDRVLELPSSGGQMAIQAALRGASVDVLCADEEHADSVEARVRAAGVAGAVHVEVIGSLVPSPRQWSGQYEAIVSVERMETLGEVGLRHYVKSIDRMLATGGVAVVQAIVAHEDMRDTARESLEVMREYLWPALEYPTVAEVRAAVLGQTGLTVSAENYVGSHLRTTLPLWRANFLARERQAAAAGFDQVFRRLWDYQLALHEALVNAGDIDCVQFVLRPR
ncbi:MAG TPA: class I SAM-dependent methyltransferase [Candidatus Corynebacterium gallistercoris]|uniref:Class I SAM-dependent methyltransferase n=1 Tax=Candidatus Corynebacterium gallistercoris TaxID=2838530 RepID=A0A9D1UR86_9CORY|nr:class I SAM-dependent methyltransferase [Candidatus Corynebacterium gallistercoris]